MKTIALRPWELAAYMRWIALVRHMEVRCPYCGKVWHWHSCVGGKK